MAKAGFRIIDSDLHLIEPADLFEQYLEKRFREQAPRREASVVSGQNTWAVDGKPTPHWIDWPEFRNANSRLWQKKEDSPVQVEAFERGFDAASTLRAMDIEGVDVAPLYRSAAGVMCVATDGLDPPFRSALCRAYNDWLANFCKADPVRLKGVALIPLHDISFAIEESRRAVQQLGFVGVSLYPEPVGGRMLYDLDVEPLWDALEELHTAVGIHGSSNSTSDVEVSRRYLQHPAPRVVSHAITFPFQTMGVMAGMLLSGVLERHPGLRVAFLEANCGWLSWFLYRLDEQSEKYADAELAHAPSEYFLRQCFISMDSDEAVAEDVIRRWGDDFVIISTDYPHADSPFPHAMDQFLELGFPAETKRKILWDNCARLYGLL